MSASLPRTALMAAALLALGACSGEKLTPFRADPVLAALPTSCTPPANGTGPTPESAQLLPGGLSVVRSEGRDVVLVALRGCIVTVDAASGATEPLPTRGDSIAPTMVDGASNGLAFSSSLSGTVRAIDDKGQVTVNVSGLGVPLGLRLMPGGVVLVVEFANGRILRAGPGMDSRVRLVADGLAGPVDLVVVDATRAYVTETTAGRVSEIKLDQYAKRVIATELDRPEGIAVLPGGAIAVAEAGARRVVSIDPRSGRRTVLADNLPIGLESPGGPDDPYTVSGLATSADGTLYLTSDRDRTVLRITPRTTGTN